jgi:hypothetical protein
LKLKLESLAKLFGLIFGIWPGPSPISDPIAIVLSRLFRLNIFHGIQFKSELKLSDFRWV